jgi:hypothetical protein
MYEFSPENLRNPARVRRAGAMRQFPSDQLYSSDINSCTKYFSTSQEIEVLPGLAKFPDPSYSLHPARE